MGQNILICGASRGLGFFLAKKFQKKNNKLCLLSRNIKNLKKIFYKKKEVYLVRCDLASTKSIDNAVKKIKKIFLKIDVIVNCAAVTGPVEYFHKSNITEWKKAFEIDFLNLIYLKKKLIPFMLKNGGSIINLSGGGATSSRKFFSSYAYAKTSLVRFSEILSEELEKYKINVNCVAPGILKTKLFIEGERNLKNLTNQKPKRKNFSKMENVYELMNILINNKKINGKLISVQWDNWKTFSNNNRIFKNKNIFTLRRQIKI